MMTRVFWDRKVFSMLRLFLFCFLMVGLNTSTLGRNLKVENFRKSKKLLTSVYKGSEVTFYCGCKYTGKEIDKACNYVPKNRKNARSQRIEWEHIVFTVLILMLLFYHY